MLYYILITLIQGITEALPIGSSLHLDLLNLENPSIMHLGSSLAFASYTFTYWKRYLLLNIANIKSILKIFLITLPTIITGYILKTSYPHIRHAINPFYINALFAIIMVLANKQKESCRLETLTLKGCCYIGLLSSFALLSGASRLGTAFSAFRIFQIGKKDAFYLSLITGAPILLGASITSQSLIINVWLWASLAAGIITYQILAFTEKHIKKWNYYSFYRVCFSALVLILKTIKLL